MCIWPVFLNLIKPMQAAVAHDISNLIQQDVSGVKVKDSLRERERES